MPNYDFRAQHAALIVVDMQNAFVDPNYPLATPDARSTVPGMNQLIQSCREQKIPVIWLRMEFEHPDYRDAGLLQDILGSMAASLQAGQPGVEMYPELNWRKEDMTMTKKRFSGFYQTNLEEHLKSQDIDTLIIIGTVLNVCCETTARDAFQRDFKVFFPIELNTTRPHPDLGFGEFSTDEMTKAVLTSLGSRFVQLIEADHLRDIIHANRQYHQ
jgi:nicotinamidase-related amidase